MRITIEVRTTLSRAAFLQAAALGLRSVSDEAEEILAALETAAGLGSRTGRPDVDVAAVLAACGGSVSAAARCLGIARSTVRARVRAAANDNATEVRRAG